MSGVPVEVLDYYDEEVVRRIIEKYGYGEREALGLFLDSQTYGMLVLQKNLVDYAIGMYEFYHVEAIENAFADLDRRLSV